MIRIDSEHRLRYLVWLMKIFAIVGLCLSVITSLHGARADLVDEIKITSDYYPDREYAVGFDMGADHLINRIYFYLKGSAAPAFFTLQELQDHPQTIMEIAGIKLVQMQIVNHTSNDAATIQLSYTQNYLRRTAGSMLIGVQYNAGAGHYDIYDLRDQRIIHSARVLTNYATFPHIPLGISSVITE